MTVRDWCRVPTGGSTVTVRGQYSDGKGLVPRTDRGQYSDGKGLRSDATYRQGAVQ